MTTETQCRNTCLWVTDDALAYSNTTVRTPYRLRNALRAMQDSPLNGNISGRKQENALAVLLHNEGIVVAPRVRLAKMRQIWAGNGVPHSRSLASSRRNLPSSATSARPIPAWL